MTVATVLSKARYNTDTSSLSKHELGLEKLTAAETAVPRHYRRDLRRGSAPDKGAATFTTDVLQTHDEALRQHEITGRKVRRSRRVKLQHNIEYCYYWPRSEESAALTWENVWQTTVWNRGTAWLQRVE